jgi:uncharacterized cupredoxin-like copper-binding protein
MDVRGSRVLTVVMLLGASLILAACGGGEDEEKAAAAPPPGGLAVGYVGYPEDVGRTVEVTATDEMEYEPDSISVTQGETIRFVVTNEGKLPHEFSLGDDAGQAEHEQEMAGGAMVHDHPFSVYLAPGETGELVWTFANAGTFSYACHVPGHFDAGMEAPLVVE